MIMLTEIFLKLVIAFCFVGISYCIIMLIKTDVTYRQDMKIVYAIYNYTLYCLDNSTKPLVYYSDMRSFEKSNNNLLDWGYKNILPKDKFEIIKPFILKSKQPKCFGKPNTPNGMAENGCNDCEYARMCEVKRKVAALNEDC